MKFYFRDVVPYIPGMLKGLLVNMALAVIAMLVGCLLGMLLYLGKTSTRKWLQRFCGAYIELFRNTPLLVQLYLIYFGLAQYSIDVSAFASAMIAMVLNNAAYSAEILRAGFMSIPHGTIEAGEALGMSRAQVFRIVRLMPALKSAFPALINQYVMLFLFSSVASIIALPELTYVSMNTASLTARNFEVYLITGALYYGATIIMVSLLRLCERKSFRW